MSSSHKLDSSFIASALVELESSTASQSRKWKAAVWKHYRKPTEEENQAYLYCSYYTDLTRSPYSTSISENIKKHIKSIYKLTIGSILSKG
jgi:hypothetical protein